MSNEFHQNTMPEVLVKRNNEIAIEEILALAPDRIIISPGPGTPENKDYFGICRETIEQLGQHTPILGVCLGMQGIAHCFGGQVVHAPLPMHGKISNIQHNGSGVFHGLPQGIAAMRYHSLMVDSYKLPECLEVTSVISNDVVVSEDMLKYALKGYDIMGIKHREYPIEGVQFHPESFATEGSKELLKNFLRQNIS